MSAAEADVTLTIGRRQPVHRPGADPLAAVSFFTPTTFFLMLHLFHPSPPLSISTAFPSSVRFVPFSVSLSRANQCCRTDWRQFSALGREPLLRCAVVRGDHYGTGYYHSFNSHVHTFRASGTNGF